MIDTDKYEGHTPAPWKADEPEHPHYGVIYIRPCKARVRRYQKDRATEESWYADAQLIADAPLLLAEFKRVSEQKKFLTLLFKLMNAGNWYVKYCTAIRCMQDWEAEEE
tara:strand:+ start:15 stop:341 length:327 start_codon:yes stop_codon:yes gene_type:complete